MFMTLFVWAVVALCAAVIVTIFLAIKMRRARAADKRSERAQAMEEEAYRLAKTRLIYRRKMQQEANENSEPDPLRRFGVDIQTDMRRD